MLPPRWDWDIHAFVDTTRTLSFQYPDKGHVLYVQVGTITSAALLVSLPMPRAEEIY